MDINKQLSRIKKGMELVDSGFDIKGNPLDDDNMNKHIELLRKLMRELCEYVADQKLNWDDVMKNF